MHGNGRAWNELICVRFGPDLTRTKNLKTSEQAAVMKLTLAAVAVAAVALAQSAMIVAAAGAVSAPMKSGVFAAASTQDLSAARKKKRQTNARVQTIERRGFLWRGADPSIGPDGRPYPRPDHPGCMVDLGYGRWTGCSNW